MAPINGDAQTDTGLDRPLTLALSCSSKKDLNDNDDDDDDYDLDFLSPRVFPKPSNDTTVKTTQSNKKRAKQSRIQRYQGITTKDSDKEAIRLKDKEKDPAWIEDQAKIIAGTLSMDIVRGVVDTKMVGWEFEKKRNVVKYYPTLRIAPDSDEASHLLEDKLLSSTMKNGVVVKYLGVNWSCARKYDYIASSRWEPSRIGEDAAATKRKSRRKSKTKHQLDDEGRLANFLFHIKNTARFKDNPVNLKVEEIVLRRTLETVLEQQKEFQETKVEEEKKKAAMQVLFPIVSQDDAPVEDNENRYIESDDDDENENGDNEVWDGGTYNSCDETTTPALAVGDRIEFYAPEGVAGNPMWLREAIIMRIRRDHEYPLVCNGVLFILPRTHHVRKLPHGRYRAIETYDLEDQGQTNMAQSLKDVVASLKRTRDDFNKAADDFWKNGQGENSDVHTRLMKKRRGRVKINRKQDSEQHYLSTTKAQPYPSNKIMESEQDVSPNENNNEETPRVDFGVYDNIIANNGCAVTTRSGRAVKLPAYLRKEGE